MCTDHAWYVIFRVIVRGGGGGGWGGGGGGGGGGGWVLGGGGGGGGGGGECREWAQSREEYMYIQQEAREHKQQDKTLWIMSSYEDLSNRTCQEHCQYDIVTPSSLIK